MLSSIVLILLLFGSILAEIPYTLSSPGVIVVPDDYPTIQGAINAADSGDIVYVRAGYYEENVVINKSISLVGENEEFTHIGGIFENIVYICADNVNVEHLHIYGGINVNVFIDHSFNVAIINTKISGALSQGYITQQGIAIFGSSQIAVQSIEVGFTATGIDCQDCSNIHINNSCIELSDFGIHLYECANVVISGNIFWKNRITGLFITHSYNNTIDANIFDYNGFEPYAGGMSEFPYYGGISMDACSQNIICRNEFYNDGFGCVSNCGENYIYDNLVNGKPLVYLSGVSDIEISDAGQVIVDWCTNIKLKGLSIENTTIAIQLYYSQGVSLTNCNLTSNIVAVFLNGDHFNTIDNIINNNKIISNICGIALTGFFCFNNSIVENHIEQNRFGVYTRICHDNIFYHNNFISNGEHVYDDWWSDPEAPYSHNIWDSGYPSGGNYWDSYTGTDVKKGPNQDQDGGDGIGDLPYSVCSENVDRYPLMTPWNHAPTVNLIQVNPQIVSEPTLIKVVANVTDYEDGTNLHVFCIITFPNGIRQLYNMTFNGTLFTLDYPLNFDSPLGTYTVTIKAIDSDGMVTEHQTNFINAIIEHGAVEGYVLTVYGQPICNATVVMSRQDAYLEYSTHTNVDGKFIFNNVVPGTYNVKASYTEYVMNDTTIDVQATMVIYKNFTLQRLPVLVGYVTSNNGFPIPGSQVEVSENDKTLEISSTDQYGFYRVVISKPGTFTVRASAYGYFPNSSIITTYLENVYCLNFTLISKGIVQGVIKDAISYLPISNASVFLGTEAYLGRSATTDDNGTFIFYDVIPGNYVIRAIAHNYLTNSTNVKIEFGQNLSVSVMLNPASHIRGTIIDAYNGERISDAKVALVDELGRITLIRATDVNGTYSFDDIEPGHYTLRVFRDGYNTSCLNVSVVPYETKIANFYLNPNQIYLNINVPFSAYSRGETINFIINVTNPLGENIAENVTYIGLFLIGPTNEYVTIDLQQSGKSFIGNYTIPSNATLGLWAVIVNATDTLGNLAEHIQFLTFAKAFSVALVTDKPCYTSAENATFYTYIARYSNLSDLIPLEDINIALELFDSSNNTIATLQIIRLGNIFVATYPLEGLEVGEYSVYLTVNDFQGNVATTKTTFSIVPDFTVSVQTEKCFYDRGETVKITGSALFVNGQPVANATVKIDIEIGGYIRTFFVVTDQAGAFEFNFTSYNYEAGNYTLSATVSANKIERSGKSQFVVYGLVLKQSIMNVKMPCGSTNAIEIPIGNIGQVMLTGITASITPIVDGVNVTVVYYPSTLMPGQWASIKLEISTKTNATFNAIFNLTISSYQQAKDRAEIHVNLYPATPIIYVTPQVIDFSINRGTTAIFQINITNVGYAQLQNISITSPVNSWISITIRNLIHINSLESVSFDIIIHPDESVPFRTYQDQITINSDNHLPVTIYLIITVSPSESGNLLFHITDETGTAVPDARITLQYQEYYTETLFGKTNQTGYLVLSNLPIGRYSFIITKEMFETVSGTTLVLPGKTIVEEINLPSKIIDVSFSVEPITIQDKYYVMLNLTFLTSTPSPVLVPLPVVLEFYADRSRVMQEGYLATQEVIISNTGLISINNVTVTVDKVTIPTGYSLYFKNYDTTITLGTIEAKNSVRVPVQLQINPGTQITDLPNGFVGRVKIQGNFEYYDRSTYTYCTATTASEFLVYIYDQGFRMLEVNPKVIFGFKLGDAISFEAETYTSYLPDIYITNYASYEKVYMFPIAIGGGIIIGGGIDINSILTLAATGQLGDLVGLDSFFYALGYITKGQLQTDGTLTQSYIQQLKELAERLDGDALSTILLNIYYYSVFATESPLIILQPSEQAILKSILWEMPLATDWSSAMTELLNFQIELGFDITLGCVIFTYRWEYSTEVEFCTVPIFLIDLNAPSIVLPIPINLQGAGGINFPGGIGYKGEYVFHPPSLSYEGPPTVKKVEPIAVSNNHQIIKLLLSQDETLERDAFLATLKMENKMGDTNIDNVNITLKIMDMNSVDASNNFFITITYLQNINAVDGTGTIQPLKTSIVQWIIIPKPEAGGSSSSGKFYFVQAFINYSVNQNNFSMETEKETINVKPQPLLVVDYFIPKEVRANTPFKLGIKVTNVGHGIANNLQIETAQPKIYDSVSGLPINFQIVESAIAGQPSGNSLKANFGNIQPGETKIAYWVMTADLDGTFTQFIASFTHIDSLGGAETSLIHSVNTYIVSREVAIDNVTFAFLTDPNNDGLPDAIIDEIFGNIYPVIPVEYNITYADPKTITIQTEKYADTWIWIEMDDPYENQMDILHITRSDGKLLNPQNYWMNNGQIYIIDDPDEAYTVTYRVHDIVITDVTFSNRYPIVNESITIYVTVQNLGNYNETFTLSVNYTLLIDPLIGAQTVTLIPGHTLILNFTWTPNSTGRYEIKAYISEIPDDVNPSDNTKITYIYVSLAYTSTFSTDENYWADIGLRSGRFHYTAYSL